MRMSTVVRNSLDKTFRAYVKGSPEKVAELCQPHTIPDRYYEILEEYTRKGYRVIALAYKLLDTSFVQIQSIKRDKVECDLNFLGLLIMENKLKEATKGTISTLNQCNIRTIMATGDNTLTAISVARECNILKQEQVVYFGDIENERIIWKKTSGSIDDEELPQTVTHLQGSEAQSSNAYDTQHLVPWEIDNADDFGVALNGKTLAFLHNH